MDLHGAVSQRSLVQGEEDHPMHSECVPEAQGGKGTGTIEQEM